MNGPDRIEDMRKLERTLLDVRGPSDVVVKHTLAELKSKARRGAAIDRVHPEIPMSYSQGKEGEFVYPALCASGGFLYRAQRAKPVFNGRCLFVNFLLPEASNVGNFVAFMPDAIQKGEDPQARMEEIIGASYPLGIAAVALGFSLHVDGTGQVLRRGPEMPIYEASLIVKGIDSMKQDAKGYYYLRLTTASPLDPSQDMDLIAATLKAVAPGDQLCCSLYFLGTYGGDSG